jgi:hypothetical protein
MAMVDLGNGESPLILRGFQLSGDVSHLACSLHSIKVNPSGNKAMSRPYQSVAQPTRHTIRGVVQQVDLINRAVVLRSDETELSIDVPATCTILFNGERVRLHVLQPADRVTVAADEDRGGRLARQIEVDPLA